MTRAALCRAMLFVGLVGLLEVLCLTGMIDKLTMQAPHRMVADLWRILASGSLNAAIAKTLTNAGIAFGLAMVAGVATGVLLHRLKAVRETLDPLFATYYAIPIFAFYPLLIILFGLGDAPQILIGFMLGVVAVLVNTLNGLDRVPRALIKTAQVARMGPVETALRISLPFAAQARSSRSPIRSSELLGRNSSCRVAAWDMRSASPTPISTMLRCTH